MDSFPASLNQDVLNGYFEERFGLKDVQITNCKYNPSPNKGESYLSDSGRCEVFAKGKDAAGAEKEAVFSLFTKKPPVNIVRSHTFRCAEFFKNEVTFYNKVWPALNAFQKSMNQNDLFMSIPLCISAIAAGEESCVTLEDLGAQGFRGACKSGGLDLNLTRRILKLFAQFHAIALAFKNQHPDQFEEVAGSLKETYFSNDQRVWYSGFLYKTLLKVVRDAVEKELPATYVQKFDAFTSGDFFGKLIQVCETRGPYAVITHGDAWIPNFMIKYADDDTTVLDVKMIDFQLTRCSSLATDILFFLYSCTAQALRDKHWDQLIEHYHKEFTSTLTNLGCDPNVLTLDAIRDEIKKSIFFGIGMSMEAIVMSMLEEDEVADVDGLSGVGAHRLEDVWIVHPFKSAEKRQRLSSMIKHAVDNDFI